KVMKVEREYRCCAFSCLSSCFSFCSNHIKIEAPLGQTYGYVKQSSSFWRPYYDIMDENKNNLMRIEGPCCFINEIMCPLDNFFTIMPIDRNVNLGKISKQYASIVADINSQTIGTRFGAKFPVETPIKTKSNLLGVLFMLNSMYFE
ncbi:unnamed protein product, partial [Brachionus calyciflorus]